MGTQQEAISLNAYANHIDVDYPTHSAFLQPYNKFSLILT